MSNSGRSSEKLRAVTVALTLAITAVVLLVAALQRASVRRDPRVPLLGEANALDRPVLKSRIEGLEYRPDKPITRGATSRDGLSGLRLRIAAMELLARSATEGSTEERHAQSLAHLFAGHLDEAIQTLREASARPDAPASVWSDLAAVSLERAAAEKDPREAAYALAAADRALEIQPRMECALYNRVLALDALGLELTARDAAQTYLAADAASGWSQEIRDRFRQLDAPNGAEEWKKAVLELERASQRRDLKGVLAIVHRFPQQSRSWGEGEFLGRWSDAIVTHHSAEGRQWLTASRDVGNALIETNGEGQLRAIVDHLDTCEAPDGVANTFQTYRNGRIALDQRRVTEAVPLLREAERSFERMSSPIRLLASHYLAVALLDANEVSESERVLTRLEAALKPDHLALRAQCEWHRANLLSRVGRLYEAHGAAQRSLEHFERLGEQTNRIRMQSAVATALTRLGRVHEAWTMRCAALRAAARSGDGRTIEVTLNSTVRQAIREHEWTIARAFLDAQIARGISSPRLRVDALLWRAFTEARLHGSSADVHQAVAAASDIQDEKLRDSAIVDVRFAEAVASRIENPIRAIELLNEVITWREHNGSLDLSVAYVERARARRAVQEIDRAASDLARAIDIIETQRAEITRDDVRDAFFGSAEDAYAELIDLRLDQLDAGGAFVAAERMRARIVLDRVLGQPSDAARILDASATQRALPARVQVVHYSVLPQRTFIVVFDQHGWRASTVAVGRAEMERLREGLVSAIAHANQEVADSVGRQLYKILMSQVSARPEDVIVVVPDETLAELPFSALVNAQGRYLIEENAVVAAPSAAAFVRQSQRRGALNIAAEVAVIVGDPAFDQKLFPTLTRLASAAQEVQLLKGTLPRTLALTGEEATPRRFLEEARHRRIIHMATHAVTTRNNPSGSFFVLAPDADEPGLLYQRDITAEHFAETQLVVLAGCRTAAASDAPGSVRSLAMAFLAAGSHSVLGSLWDIEDTAAADLSVRFYRHLLTESRPASALRLAQLEMLRSSTGTNRDVRSWGALQMYGTGI